ncbi:MAG: glycoside hydrolase family 28 protein [Prolixibacteraceae bacterium]|nr:glycoside hydrolase family 28 protein [Prolixibacteraceae bacterium]
MKKFLLVAFAAFTFCSYTQAKDYPITSYGAKADGRTNNGPFIQKAIDEASANGGGKVIIPPGNFASGVLTLKSGVNLHLDLGACLLGSVTRTDYDNPIAMAFLVAKDQKNISISGEGVIDGQAGELMLDVFRMLRAGTLIDNGGWSVRPSEGVRPMLVVFKGCDQVNISGVTMKNAASWVQDYINCTNLTIDGIKVQSTSYWNNDGIDISDCKNVKVINCFVNAADDGICLKSEKAGNFCDNVYVANCTIRSSASAFKMGTASYGGFKNIKVENLTIFDTFRSAIAIESVDGGHIENIDIQHIKATNTGNAIFIRLGHRNKKAEAGSVKGIYIADVKAEIPLHKPDQGYPLEGPPDVNSPDKEKMPARRSGYPFFGHPWLPFNLLPSSIVGIPGHIIQDVTLENVEITYAGGASKEIACIPPDQVTSVPECEPDYPEFSMFGELPAWGFYVRHAEGIRMKNVKISYKTDDFRPAMVFDDVKGIKLESVEIPTAKDMPVVLLNKVSGEKLEGLRMPVDEAKGIRRMNK